MSPKVPCKSKSQHPFSLWLFTGCSSGSNGVFQSDVMFIESFMDDVIYEGMLKSVWSVWFVTY